MKIAALALGAALAWTGMAGVAFAQTDLDAFMQQVLARRDDNWTKLQQYVLDERETLELRGPSAAPLWGERRDYTWYIRDGFFVRSPLKVNGATVGDADRRKYEGAFLRHEIAREKRGNSGAEGASAGGPAAPDDAPRDVDGLIRQTRQPQFISTAYFLRFKFDQGRYALVGRERLDDRDVLRIEYYPTNLFQDNGQGREGRRKESGNAPTRDDASNRALAQLMNKTSKVTLWIEPTLHQILKYTFDDLGWDFFPGSWLVRVSHATASMTMGQAFPDVWLPRSLDVDLRMMLAFGAVDVEYALEYHDYRQPDVTSKVAIPSGR